MTALDFPGGNGDQSWTYTPDGLPSQVITYNDNGSSWTTNAYTYNKRRMLTGESQAENDRHGSWTWAMGYGYNSNGHLATLSYPANMVVDFAPNALGQATKATSATKNFATNATYFPNGALKQFTYGNGIVHTLTLNARGLPARSTDAYGATKYLDDQYDYDPNGNVAGITDGATNRSQRGNRDMDYDGLDRLTRAKSPMWGNLDAIYAYDALDNLTRTKVPQTSMSAARDWYYCYDGANRLTNVKTTSCSGATVIGLGYDAQGNVSNKNGTSYVFDVANRMRSTGSETYRYDAHGRRLRVTNASSGNLYHLYGRDGQLFWTRDERDNLRRQFVYLADSLVAEHVRPIGGSTETVTYQHTDALGSPVVRTSQTRTPQWSEYEPYGKLVNRANDDLPGYTGHVMDATSGLTYMQQRYYDPGIGMFLSVDPVTASSDPVGQFHRYRYANNNPYKFTDPDGRVSYQRGNTVVIPIYYQGSGATDEFIKGQVQAASKLVAEDGTRFEIMPMKTNLFPRSNIMDVSPGTNPNTIEGEGIIKNTNGSAAHIDSTRSDVAGATLHDSLHFVPGLSDGRKSDGYTQGTDQDGNRVRTGYKAGFGPGQIMASTSGNMLKSFETSFMNDAFNGNGSADDLMKLLKDDAK